MMTLPFFICALALWLSWRGHRLSALVVTLVAVVVVFALYRLHATDTLGIDL